MNTSREVVVTGLGIVSPIGLGAEAFWQALDSGTSGVGPLSYLPAGTAPVTIAAEVRDFDPGERIKPRKALKVMSRDIQMAMVAAAQAVEHSGLAVAEGDAAGRAVHPERLGVELGCDLISTELVDLIPAYRHCMREGRFEFSRWGQALSEIFPLWFLKYLPNMPACHVGITVDARGPNNTFSLGDVSSLTALGEAADTIRRGQADAMLAGGVGTRIKPIVFSRAHVGQLSHRNDEPERACRPFDQDRDGTVNGEGAAVLVLEERTRAERRGARILGRVLGHASRFRAPGDNGAARQSAVAGAIRAALDDAGVAASDIGHVGAHGTGTTDEDPIEAQAVRSVLGEVPVTALKSYFGHLGSGAGAMELAGSLLALVHGRIPPTLNYDRPDPACPVNVVHGQPLTGRSATAVVVGHAPQGQAVAVVLAGE
jgi:3-oxoacyl-[acyl-carrier-protein] synthase II